MAVIGRLDDQVSEKIIEPLAGKIRREAGEEMDHAARQTLETENQESRRKVKDEELPVWLL